MLPTSFLVRCCPHEALLLTTEVKDVTLPVMNSSTTDVRKPAMARRPTQSCAAGKLLRKGLICAEGAEKCTESTDRCSSVALHDAGSFAQNTANQEHAGPATTIMGVASLPLERA